MQKVHLTILCACSEIYSNIANLGAISNSCQFLKISLLKKYFYFSPQIMPWLKVLVDHCTINNVLYIKMLWLLSALLHSSKYPPQLVSFLPLILEIFKIQRCDLQKNQQLSMSGDSCLKCRCLVIHHLVLQAELQIKLLKIFLNSLFVINVIYTEYIMIWCDKNIFF